MRGCKCAESCNLCCFLIIEKSALSLRSFSQKGLLNAKSQSAEKDV